MKFGTVSPGRYTGADRYTGVAIGRRSTVRSHYIQKYFSHPSPATFISLMSSKSHNVIRDITGFIYHAGKLHSLNIV